MFIKFYVFLNNTWSKLYDGVVKLNSLQVPTLLCIVQDMEQDVHSSSNDKSELYNKYDDDRESNDASKILR